MMNIIFKTQTADDIYNDANKMNEDANIMYEGADEKEGGLGTMNEDIGGGNDLFFFFQCAHILYQNLM